MQTLWNYQKNYENSLKPAPPKSGSAPTSPATASLARYSPDNLAGKDLFNINDWLSGSGDLYATNVGTAENAYGRGLGGSGGMNTLGALRQDAYYTNRHKLGNEALQPYLARGLSERQQLDQIAATRENQQAQLSTQASIANMNNATQNRAIDGQVESYLRSFMGKSNQLNSGAGAQTVLGGSGGGGSLSWTGSDYGKVAGDPAPWSWSGGNTGNADNGDFSLENWNTMMDDPIYYDSGNTSGGGESYDFSGNDSFYA